jgi:universal stress protein A
MKIRKILVPVDFSLTSLQALGTAIDLARRFGAQLVVLHVFEPFYYGSPPGFVPRPAKLSGLISRQRSGAKMQLERLGHRLRQRRVKPRTLFKTGAPYEVIVRAAKQQRADLLVIATHGRSGLSRLLIGSVAERIVRAASCPVLTIPRSRRKSRS